MIVPSLAGAASAAQLCGGSSGSLVPLTETKKMMLGLSKQQQQQQPHNHNSSNKRTERRKRGPQRPRQTTTPTSRTTTTTTTTTSTATPTTTSSARLLLILLSACLWAGLCWQARPSFIVGSGGGGAGGGLAGLAPCVEAFNVLQGARSSPSSPPPPPFHFGIGGGGGGGSAHQHPPHQHGRRPDSSSSIFADIEDLTDSSIRTRVGVVELPLPAPGESVAEQQQQQQHWFQSQMPALLQQQQAGDFDRLIDRILQPLDGRAVFSPAQQALVAGFNGHGATVAADANNRTTMRFFRNNKTFASIVYTNENHPQPVTLDGPAAPAPAAAKQPRRLINCHLVDLEKHSSDVALFEAKYEIKTIDIEFKEMMQLIDSCTNIARLKPLRPTVPLGSQQPPQRPNAAQLFAASLPSSQQQQQHHQQQPPAPNGHPTASHMPSGRPAHIPQFAEPSAAAAAATGSSAANSVSTFQKVMSGALNQQLESLGPMGPTSTAKLELPTSNVYGGPTATGAVIQLQQRPKRNNLDRLRRFNSSVLSGGPTRPPWLSKALAKATGGEPIHKLVLGEVTPPASAVEGRQGGIKEALQEITSYDTTDLMAIWRGILPGTNWCGMGDRATSYNDLGFESDIDICCRAHDFCPIRLSAFSAGYGLFNWSFYTRSHCWCDQNFLDCLQRADSPLSSVVMKFYFTIMKTTCLHDNETGVFGGGGGSGSGGTGGHSTTARHRIPSADSGSGVWRPPTSTDGRGGPMAPTSAQQRLLLDQIRASLPIPAQTKSQVTGTTLEQWQKQQQQQQQQQQSQAPLLRHPDDAAAAAPAPAAAPTQATMTTTNGNKQQQPAHYGSASV